MNLDLRITGSPCPLRIRKNLHLSMALIYGMNTMGFDAHAVRQSSNSLSANIVALHKQRITNHALAHSGVLCMELADSLHQL